jgi:predicted negative regulator of RcsB-dependent stress response
VLAGSDTLNLVWIVFFWIIGLGIAMCFQYFIAKKRAQVEMTSGEQYRQLAGSREPWPWVPRWR